MKLPDPKDIAYFVGLGAVCAGLWGYDWRLALVGCGLVLLATAIAAWIKTAPRRLQRKVN